MQEGKLYSRVFQGIAPWLTRKISFNYIYFGLFFILLLLLNLYGILTVQRESLWVKVFFLFHNLGQVVIEFIGMVLLSIVIKRYLRKGLYRIYTGLLFMFVFLQFAEAALVKTMDLSVAEGIHVAFGADLKNFVEFLHLSELGMGVWYSIFTSMILFPFLGALIYKITENISVKNKVVVRFDVAFTILCITLMTLSVMDGCAFGTLSHAEYSAYKKSLPWKSTFLKVPNQKIPLQEPLKSPRNEQEILKTLALYEPQISKKPNIYLFVAESLRKDYLTEVTAPHLMTFKRAHIAPHTTLSNANHTVASWFSIFHSAYPFYWAYSKNPAFEQGSIPLNVLKKLGYKIHVYSSAQLKYYDFDQTMLGKNHLLADTLKLAPHYGAVSASDSDTEVMQTFQKDLLNHPKEGNLYIFFLDSTHFNYSWPQGFSEKYAPADVITWKHRFASNDQFLTLLKNRYRNSISFVDHLFGQTMQTLKKLKIYDESIVVFCGDHGEEFKEEGKLFHASHLSPQQMHIPLFYKFGKNKQEVAVSSHIDIFPSILDYLDPDKRFLSYLDGHSIFQSSRPSFGVVARFNSSSHSYEFLIHNGTDTLLAKFNKKHDIFSSTALKILESNLSQEEVKEQFKEAFDHLFQESKVNDLSTGQKKQVDKHPSLNSDFSEPI